MQILLKVILNRNMLFFLSIVCGLFIPQLALSLKTYVIFILGTMMAFSLTGLEAFSLKPIGKIIGPIIGTILLSYVVLGGVIFLMGKLLITDSEFFTGFVIVAVCPPGAAVIPLSFLLKANIRYAVLGVMGSYLFFLLWAPFIILTYTPVQEISMGNFYEILLILLIIPFLVSRIFLWKPLKKTVFPIRGKVVNLCFALTIYAVVGSNHELLSTQTTEVFLILLILILCTFGLNIIYEFLGRRLFPVVGYETIATQMMMISMKNSGFAIAIALSLFGDKVSIPALINGIVVLLNFMFLSIRFTPKLKEN